jgi:hypothetical protein
MCRRVQDCLRCGSAIAGRAVNYTVSAAGLPPRDPAAYRQFSAVLYAAFPSFIRSIGSIGRYPWSYELAQCELTVQCGARGGRR